MAFRPSFYLARHMANTRNGNTWWADTSSAGATASSFISERNLKIVGIAVTASAVSDVVEVFDKAAASDAAGAKKLTIKLATAGKTETLDFSERALVCPNGLWLTLTGTPVVTFILSSTGG